MSNTKHPKDSPHFLQKLTNDLLDRTVLATTMKLGQTVEFSNGVSIIFKKKKGTSMMLVLLVPREVKAYWEVKQKVELTDEHAKEADKINCN